MIHQYINNGYNIVLDVNSGSVHVVDPLSYELIALADKRLEEGKSEEEIRAEAKEQFRGQYSEEDIIEALGEIWELKELRRSGTRHIRPSSWIPLNLWLLKS